MLKRISAWCTPPSAAQGDAEASYRRALAIDPGNGDANYNYGVLLAVTGRTSDARRLLDAACSARVASACRLLPDLAKPR